MNPDRWQQIKQVFNDALQREPSARAAFLAEACADDAGLRAEVEKLLNSYETDFLAQPAIGELAETIVGARQQLKVGQRLGRYRMTQPIGKGGMGEVYLAHDTELERDVALKILSADVAADQQRMQRFIQEAKTASALNHPNIITIHEVGQAEGLRFIATEYIKGETLRQRLRREPLTLRECFEVAVQVAAALSAAHEAKVVHRDIKPENIMLRPDGLVKVLDFGLAKLTEGATAVQSLGAEAATRLQINTAPGVVMGTFNYMSPEQARGKEVDLRTDIWSFGVVLYEMVAGRLPFTGETNSDVMASILKNEPTPLSTHAPDTPPELQRIIRKALRKERDERYQTVKDLLLDLKSLQRDLEFAAEVERSTPLELRNAAPTARASGAVSTTQAGIPQTASVEQMPTVSSAEYIVSEIRRQKRKFTFALAMLVAGIFIIAYGAYKYLPRLQTARPSPQRALTRLTYDSGLQSEPTWSPDTRFIAYSSDRGGNFDIWVQALGGGNPVQVTKSSAQDWQPDWSPDGNSIVFRSERDGGGLYIVPVLGGTERRIASFGYRPRWSPDGSQILFFNSNERNLTALPKLFVVGPDGGPPQQVLAQFLASFKGRWQIDWYPDGRRVSILVQRRGEGDVFWTVPLDGANAVKSEISPEAEKELKAAAVDLSTFQWSPAKNALYFEGVSHGLRNLWKIEVDPQTQRWISGPERLTVGAGADMEAAISRDGSKLAFVTQSQHTAFWSLPFDAASGKLRGEGEKITSADVNPFQGEIARDGKKMVFVAERAGKYEIRLKSLTDNSETVLVSSEKLQLLSPRFSRDAARVAYDIDRPVNPDQSGWSHTSEHSIAVISVAGGSAQPLTSSHQLQGWPWDWTADQTMIIGSSARQLNDHFGLYLFPLSAAPHAEDQMRLVTEHPGYDAYSGVFSPNEQWLAFVAVRTTDEADRHLYVMPSSGGDWTPLVPGAEGDDGAHWSPDGKTIYFYMNRSGFRNMWGIRFDPVAGKPSGEPFRVTNYETLDRRFIGMTGVSADHLILRIGETSGGIWMLDNVNR